MQAVAVTVVVATGSLAGCGSSGHDPVAKSPSKSASATANSAAGGSMCHLASDLDFYGHFASGAFGPMHDGPELKAVDTSIVSTATKLMKVIPVSRRADLAKVLKGERATVKMWTAAHWRTKNLSKDKAKTNLKLAQKIAPAGTRVTKWLQHTCASKTPRYGLRPSNAPSTLPTKE